MQHSVIRSLIPRWGMEGEGVGFYILIILYLLMGTLLFEADHGMSLGTGRSRVGLC